VGTRLIVENLLISLAVTLIFDLASSESVLFCPRIGVCLKVSSIRSDVNMFCYWGAQVREGFGLLQPDKVKHGKCGIRSVCPKSAVQDMSAGRSFVGFIRNGKVSVLKLRGENCDQDGKLSTY